MSGTISSEIFNDHQKMEKDLDDILVRITRIEESLRQIGVMIENSTKKTNESSKED